MLFTAFHFEINLKHKPKAAAVAAHTGECVRIVDRQTMRGTKGGDGCGSVYVVLENQLTALDNTENFD